MEQLNIEGKRSGQGFVAHKAMLVKALLMAVAERVTLVADITVGRKGLLGYLRALGGSNVVKVIPSNSGDSGEHTTKKSLKVICGVNTSNLKDGQWIKQGTTNKKGEVRGQTPMTFCDVRITPHFSIIPNVGATELAYALNKVLPFTAKDNDTPVLRCVLFRAKDGKLTLVGTDGIKLSVVSLDFEDTEAEALIDRDDLKGIANALRKANRARVSFGDNNVKTMDIDTEVIRYRFQSVKASYPDYEKLIPSQYLTSAHLDTVEAVRAIRPLLTVTDGQAVDLAIGEGKIIVKTPDNEGEAMIMADTDGEAMRVRVNASYLTSALKACGGMADFKVYTPCQALAFSQNGYQALVMPMVTDEAKTVDAEIRQRSEAKAEVAPTDEPVEPTNEPELEPTPTASSGKRSRKKSA